MARPRESQRVLGLELKGSQSLYKNYADIISGATRVFRDSLDENGVWSRVSCEVQLLFSGDDCTMDPNLLACMTRTLMPTAKKT